MKNKMVLGTVAGAFIGLIALTGTAEAHGVTAVASASLNVRSGPGTNYRPIDVLHPGERVSVDGCQYGWCYISHRGPDGWVSQRYLQADYPRQPAHPQWNPPRPPRGPGPRHGGFPPPPPPGPDSSVTFSFSF